jgi:opacity protein-like surface antigen
MVKNVLFVVGFSLFATSAFAEHFYFSAGGGLVAGQNLKSEIIGESITETDPVADGGAPPNDTLTSTITTITDLASRNYNLSTGYAGYAAVGKRLHKFIRIELEYTYKLTDTDNFSESFSTETLIEEKVITDPDGTDGEPNTDITQISIDEVATANSFDLEADLTVQTIMTNLIWDFDLDKRVTPFAAIGLGLAIVNLNGEVIDESDVTFAWQGLVGLSAEIIENLNGQVFYRFLGVPGVEILGESYRLDSHSVEMGFVYSF